MWEWAQSICCVGRRRGPQTVASEGGAHATNVRRAPDKAAVARNRDPIWAPSRSKCWHVTVSSPRAPYAHCEYIPPTRSLMAPRLSSSSSFPPSSLSARAQLRRCPRYIPGRASPRCPLSSRTSISLAVCGVGSCSTYLSTSCGTALFSDGESTPPPIPPEQTFTGVGQVTLMVSSELVRPCQIQLPRSSR